MSLDIFYLYKQFQKYITLEAKDARNLLHCRCILTYISYYYRYELNQLKNWCKTSIGIFMDSVRIKKPKNSSITLFVYFPFST